MRPTYGSRNATSRPGHRTATLTGIVTTSIAVLPWTSVNAELRDRFEFFGLRRECDPLTEAEELAAYWRALDALDQLLAGRL